MMEYLGLASHAAASNECVITLRNPGAFGKEASWSLWCK